MFRMNFGRYLIISVFSVLCLEIFANPTRNIVPEEHKEVQTSNGWSLYSVKTLGVALLVIGVGAVYISSLFIPFFSYKLCYLLGGCQDTLDFYMDHLLGGDFQTRKVNKRSTDYLDNILDLLIGAYEKYADPEGKKNFNPARSSVGSP